MSNGVIEDEVSTIPGGGEIIPPESKSAELFVPNGLDKILAEVRKRVEQHQPDVSTEKGRKAIASLARWVSNQKSTVEEYGKKRSMAIKIQAVDIDAERKRGKEAFDVIRDQARKPLDDYEAAVKARVDAHTEALKEVMDLSNPPFGADAAEIEWRIAKLDEFALRNWEEFAGQFGISNEAVGMRLGRLLAETKQAEQDRITLKKLKDERIARESAEAVERQAREQQERDDRIAREATEKAERAAQEREAKAAQDAIEAAAKAERDQAAAVEAERQRAEREWLAEESKTKARRDDLANKDRVHSAIHDSLSSLGLSDGDAAKVLNALAEGRIPNILVLY